MAAPNIVGLTTITGKTAVQNCTTSAVAMVTNSAASGQVYKVNTILAANKSTTSEEVTVDIFRSSTSYPLAYMINVPTKASLVLSGKDTAFYLEEGDVIRITATAASAIVVTISYEVIS